MKLKRDEFKVMLKECILELVQEGKIFQGTMSSAQRPQQVPGVGSINEVADGGDLTPNTRLSEAVRITAHMVSKGDPAKAYLRASLLIQLEQLCRSSLLTRCRAVVV